MTNSINYSEIKGFSKLFVDFINESKFLLSRFHSNTDLFSLDSNVREQADTFSKREELIRCLQNSMSNLNLSPNQIQNIEYLAKNRSLTVTTKTKVGFLGGPLLNFYKIQSAIEYSEKFKSTYKFLEIIPVVIVEDDDNDNFESSHISILTKDFKIKTVNCCSDCEKNSIISVANLKFSDEIKTIIDSILSLIPETAYKRNISTCLSKIYKKDKSWTDSYIEFINTIFGNQGLLILRASVIRNSGLFSNLVINEINNIGKSLEIVGKANKELSEIGYEIKAKCFDINLYYHKDHKRHKLNYDPINHKIQIDGEILDTENFMELINKDISSLSPNIILKPIFFDSVLPNIANITGPSELSFIAQLKELYEFFKIDMPAYIPRYSATLVPIRIKKTIDSLNLQIFYFLRNFEEIEKDIMKNLTDKYVEQIINDGKQQIERVVEYINLAVENLKIEETGNLALKRIRDEMEVYESRILEARNRKRSIILQKYQSIANVLYPNSSLQERFFSPVSFIGMIGFESFTTLLKLIEIDDNAKHYFVEI